MLISIEVDQELLAEAHELSGFATVEETVSEALRELIQRRKQLKIFELFGTIEFDPGYDYKKERRRKRNG